MNTLNNKSLNFKFTFYLQLKCMYLKHNIISLSCLYFLPDYRVFILTKSNNFVTNAYMFEKLNDLPLIIFLIILRIEKKNNMKHFPFKAELIYQSLAIRSILFNYVCVLDIFFISKKIFEVVGIKFFLSSEVGNINK